MGSHRSLWGHNKSQNKLTAALFLEHDDVKQTVYSIISIFSLQAVSLRYPLALTGGRDKCALLWDLERGVAIRLELDHYHFIHNSYTHTKRFA